MIMTPSFLYGILLLLTPALAHMELSWPYSIRSQYNPKNTYQNIDYSMTSPLFADGSNFPCKGYQNDRPVDVVTQYIPGQTYNFTLAGTATHGGGSCQICLSYDNGATFRVIKSIIGGCPLKSRYDFTVPSYVPQGQALLGWTWQNKLGNREYYMGCAEVQIIGSAKRHRRDGFNSFDNLPLIWKANLPDVNNCTTAEGEIPVYSEPGPDVEYGDGKSSSSPSTPGDCDAATPYGATYQNLGDSTEKSGSSSPASTSSISASPSKSSRSATASSSGVSAPVPSTSTSSPGQEPSTFPVQPPSTAALAYLRPSAITLAAWDTVEGPSYTTTPETVATTTMMARSMSQAPLVSLAPYRSTFFRAGVQEISPLSTVTVTVNCEPTTITIIITPTVFLPNVSTTSTPAPSASAGSAPPYATGDLRTYLPCVPGTFLCTSDTTFYTCNYDAASSSGDWAYGYPRVVADGLECLPYLSPYSPQTEIYGQQTNAPAAYYRDDRYIRSRPNGNCEVDGELQCAAGGSTFEICDQGGWVAMGPVADGTICQDGQIVAS